ncbi:MAG: hypothetical protein JSV83_01005 [Desulfobacterales bacterium]|nr:MAG: hypothetical protein JSV83_01005 [Desulfobacterales bacterium]
MFREFENSHFGFVSDFGIRISDFAFVEGLYFDLTDRHLKGAILPIPGNLLTTAMAVMPHKDSTQALEVALSLDIPFWPQLPRLSYYEDMYVQASEHSRQILSKRTMITPH